MILDLSFPNGSSVNDGISHEDASVSYQGLDAAIERVVLAGRGALMGKFDIKNAYHNIPVHVDDRHLLGMRWKGKYFVDLALSFGLRSAPAIFRQSVMSYNTY